MWIAGALFLQFSSQNILMSHVIAFFCCVCAYMAVFRTSPVFVLFVVVQVLLTFLFKAHAFLLYLLAFRFLYKFYFVIFSLW